LDLETTSSAGALLRLGSSAGGGGTYVGIQSQTYGNAWTSGAPSEVRFIDDGAFSNHISFLTKTPGASSNTTVERLRIASSGNVGIGTTNPGNNLHVVTSATQGTGGITASSSSGKGSLTFAPYAAVGDWNGLTQAGDQVIMFSGAAQATGGLSIVPWANATTGLRIDAGTGNVGIGTSTPTATYTAKVGSALGGGLNTTYNQVSLGPNYTPMGMEGGLGSARISPSRPSLSTEAGSKVSKALTLPIHVST
jgi:hypothetical protein